MLEPNKPKTFGPQKQEGVQVDAAITTEVLTNDDYEAIQPAENCFDEGIFNLKYLLIVYIFQNRMLKPRWIDEDHSLKKIIFYIFL